MVDLLEQLKDKPDPLRKKTQDMGIPTPTQPNLAQSVGSTQKQAEMSASPQALQKRSEEQKAQRSAQVQAQAPRDIAAEAGDYNTQAQNLITKLADFNTESWSELQTSAIQGGPVKGQQTDATLDPSVDLQVGDRYSIGDPTQLHPNFGLPAGAVGVGDVVEYDGTKFVVVQDASLGVDARSEKDLITDPTAESMDATTVISDAITAGEYTDTLNITLGELKTLDPDMYAEFQGFTGLGDDATLEDIKTTIETEIDNITLVVDDARETLNDPNAPAAVRQEAAQRMKDYGAAHMIATDAQLEDFESDMKSVGLIEFGGQSYTLEDLANNEGVAATILSAAQTLIDNPDATAEDLGLTDSPTLEAFVKKHTNSILSVLEVDADNLKAANEHVNVNKAITENIPEGITSLIGEINPYTTEDLVSNTPGLVALTPDFDPGSVGLDSSIQVSETLEYMAEHNPEGVKSFMESGDTSQLKTLVQNTIKHKNVMSIDSPTALGEHLGLDFEQLNEVVTDAKNNPDNYSPEQLEVLNALNPDGFGITNFKEAKEQLAQLALDGKTFNLAGVQTLDQKNKTQFKDIMKTGGITRDILTPGNFVKGNRAKVETITQVIKELRALDNPAAVPLIKKLAKKKFDITAENKRILKERKDIKEFRSRPSDAPKLKAPPEFVPTTYDPNLPLGMNTTAPDQTGLVAGATPINPITPSTGKSASTLKTKKKLKAPPKFAKDN